MQIPRRKADELKKRDDGPIHLTEDALKRLKEKLERYKRSVPDLAAEAARTAAYGDRSDNAEYKQAKGSLRHAHWEILSIEDQLKRTVVIPTGPNKSGIVQLGSTVVLVADEKQKTYQILGPHETNPTKGIISNQSPLGTALVGKKKGDEVLIKSNNGTKIYQIVEIN